LPAFRGVEPVWTVNLDGSNLTQVTNSEGDGQGFAPQWSPDGMRLAFRARIFAYTLGGPVQGGGSLDLLIVVPADGKIDALDKNYLQSVGPITNGTEEIIGVNGVVVVKRKDERGRMGNTPVANDVAWR
jgi:Tol biopolymer transport system component